MRLTQTPLKTSQELYASLPLLAERSIRLLSLLPCSSYGGDTATIRCELQVHELKFAPPYEALSYVWGPPEPASQIICHGVLMKIGPNLAGALRRLQKHGNTGYRLIWIDALCINQEDLAERSSQVAFMKSIYELAEKVNICLGDDDGLTEEGLDIIRTAASYCRDEMAKFGVATIQELPGETVDSSDEARGLLPPWNSLLWSQVSNIFARPWFSRVWVVQEASNKNVEVMIGSMATLPWVELWTAGGWFIRKMFRWAHGVDVMGLLAHERAANSKNQPSTIAEWLFSPGHFNATDPRDRVYALYGLAKESFVLNSHPLTIPDYEKTVAEVFQGVTRFMLLKEKTKLVALGLITPFGSNREGNFPSWVPRFDQSDAKDRPRLYSIALASEWNAGGDLPVQIRDDDHLHYLTLKGIVVSSITSVLALDIDEDHFPQSVKKLYTRAAEETGIFGKFKDERSFKNSFMRTLTADQRQTGDESSPPWGAENLDLLLSIPDDQYQNEVQTIYNLESVVQRPGPVIICNKNMLGKAVIDDTRPGDVICVFLGGYVPHIIRPMGDHFTFVSECYVQDLMGGKAIDEWKAGTMKDEWIELR